MRRPLWRRKELYRRLTGPEHDLSIETVQRTTAREER